MAELTYAELTQGRESTRLPHTHIFTSLKNVVILSKKEYARKRTHKGCLVQIESPVTQDNCSASLGKPRDAEQLTVVTEFSIRMSQPLKILIIK